MVLPLHYEKIVVLTGAGISVASGLRPFRGPGGIWNNEEVERLGTPGGLKKHPRQFWNLFGPLRTLAKQAEPNAGHLALARWEKSLPPNANFTLITQNVDGLHQKAGSQHVVELHGTLFRTRCTDPLCPTDAFNDESDPCPNLPRCDACGELLRPDFVLFEEMLPIEAERASTVALRDCDLFVAVGTSGTVWPAASFVRSAKYAGARTVLINLEPLDPPNASFDEQILGPAEQLLPQWLGF